MLKILLTYPETLPHETLLLNNLMEGDWDFLHIRKPDYSRDEMINFLELIPNHHDKVILHSHFELLREFDVAGININRKTLAQISFEDELTSGCDQRFLLVKNHQLYVNGERPDLVTYSAHSFKEIQEMPFMTDYVFLSPIFDSISKTGYESAFNDAEVLTAFLANSKQRVIALGGVDADRIAICEELGFRGYAMLGDIWKRYFSHVETIQ